MADRVKFSAESLFVRSNLLVNWSAAGSNKLSIIELTVLAIHKRRVELVLLS
jgi:hypothetical protein